MVKHDDPLTDSGSVSGHIKQTLSPNQTDCESVHTTFEPVRDNQDIVSEETTAKKPRSYPDEFEAVWKAYPHHKGRSSKPNSLAAWKKLPSEERESLSGAIDRFKPNVAEVCGGKGAPCMSRWLKDGKHLNWSADTEEPSSYVHPQWSGPSEIRQAVVREAGPAMAVNYLDTAQWTGDAIVTRTAYGASKLSALDSMKAFRVVSA